MRAQLLPERASSAQPSATSSPVFGSCPEVARLCVTPLWRTPPPPRSSAAPLGWAVFPAAEPVFYGGSAVKYPPADHGAPGPIAQQVPAVQDADRDPQRRGGFLFFVVARQWAVFARVVLRHRHISVRV